MNVAGSTHRASRSCVWLARSLVAIAAATALTAATIPAAHAGMFVSVNFAPPALPVYVQPAIPGPGYIWTPGYWAYDPVSGYYWVPGTWVLPPYAGALWTPGYWGWGGGMYAFHPGYWGLHVGYYGGINYGFGYVGVGYVGGYWGPGGFHYNREVNRITNVNITNVYNKTVVIDNNTTRVSYNGGPGGISAQPTAEEARYASERRTPAVAAQMQHQALASHTESMRASVNHGNPTIAATARPSAFSASRVDHAAVPNSHAEMRSASYAQHQGAAQANFAEHKQPLRTDANRSTNHATQSYAPHASARSMNARPASMPHANTTPHANGERVAPHLAAHEGKAEHR
ncbi:MAG: YXWGXW repeat-containing protein [Proteobacteria bacterium]|uniref:YXWGXW repeat-containing protein n=1 Tax=Rudaea sp. TaxID=2136325 RepID=UPI003784AAAB|nr:YXWGXW repeat-containing protein [Pseudomonadota bacterium]